MNNKEILKKIVKDKGDCVKFFCKGNSKSRAKAYLNKQECPLIEYCWFEEEILKNNDYILDCAKKELEISEKLEYLEKLK